MASSEFHQLQFSFHFQVDPQWLLLLDKIDCTWVSICLFSFPMSSNRFLVLQRKTISEYSYLLESLFNSERESITNADSCCRFSVFPFRIRTFDAVSEGTHFEVAEAEGKPSSGASSLILVISCRHQDTSSRYPQTGWWCRLKPRRVSLQCVAFVWDCEKFLWSFSRKLMEEVLGGDFSFHFLCDAVM